MRPPREPPDPRAREAIDLFVYRIVREIGSLAAAPGGLGGVGFPRGVGRGGAQTRPGGIGQRDAKTRQEVVAGCGWLGAELDDGANARANGRIDAASSQLPVWVI